MLKTVPDGLTAPNSIGRSHMAKPSSKTLPLATYRLMPGFVGRRILTETSKRRMIMGYSTPKKQLDLKEFLAKPGKPPKPRNAWKRTAMPPSKVMQTDDDTTSKKT